jgi:hypothetical protein
MESCTFAIFDYQIRFIGCCGVGVRVWSLTLPLCPGAFVCGKGVGIPLWCAGGAKPPFHQKSGAIFGGVGHLAIRLASAIVQRHSTIHSNNHLITEKFQFRRVNE